MSVIYDTTYVEYLPNDFGNEIVVRQNHISGEWVQWCPKQCFQLEIDCLGVKSTQIVDSVTPRACQSPCKYSYRYGKNSRLPLFNHRCGSTRQLLNYKPEQHLSVPWIESQKSAGHNSKVGTGSPLRDQAGLPMVECVTITRISAKPALRMRVGNHFLRNATFMAAEIAQPSLE